MEYEYFGFREPPFNVTPDPRFFYNHSVHQEALATLRYGIEARKGFIVITGEAGTGKTVLLRLLMRSLSPAVRTAFIFNNTRVTFAGLLRTVLHDLGLTPLGDDRVSLTAQLNDFLLQQLGERRIVSLIIDEAQDLSHDLLEEIRLLSNFETDSDKLLQIVLVGQPELDTKLDGSALWQLKQRVILRRRLTPLGNAEVGPYILTRLHVAGYGGEQLFESRAIQNIAAYARGIPRVINVICDNALECAWHAKSKVVTAAMVDRVARNLQLHEPTGTQVELTNQPTATSNGRQSGADRSLETADLTETWQPITPGPIPDHPRAIAINRTAVGPQNRPWLGLVTLLSLTTLTATGLLFYSHQINRSQSPFVSEESSSILPQAFEHDVVSLPSAQSQQPGKSFRGERSNSAQPMPAPREKDSAAIKTDATTNSVHSTPLEGTRHLRQTTRSASSQSLRPDSSRLETKRSRADVGTAENNQALTPREAYLEVMSASAVRNRPRPDAAITATLQPGTWVKLVAEHGDYLQIQSLNDSDIAGYVQRAHGHFEPLRVTLSPMSRQPMAVKSSAGAADDQLLERAARIGPSEAYFEVITTSAVRNRPRPDAAITATLQPGTWVKLVAEHGDYLQIQSLNDSDIAGYVQRARGSLEPLHAKPPPKSW